MDLVVHPFFDRDTFTWSYLIANPPTRRAAIIDPVLGYERATGTIDTRGAERILEVVEANGYCVEWILETHVHADHLTAARYLKPRLPCAQIAIGEHVRDAQALLAPRLGLGIATDGRQFDRLLRDGERLRVGHACGRVMHTPGHTGACVSYLFDGLAFVGDTVFLPDQGTARCDFPGGDPRELYHSVQKLYRLPGDTRLLVGHDYGGLDRTRDFRFSARVAEQRVANRMLRADTPVTEFVEARTARDRSLDPPALIEPALRANLDGGTVPPAAAGDGAAALDAKCRAVA
ncbi:MAG TPA: MBL fold metallo-hydrolase [Pseudomonadales bacterium]